MKKILLKFSGEAIAGNKKNVFDNDIILMIANQIKDIVDNGIAVAIVIGGGNLFRGRISYTIDKTKADQIGMLATIMNCTYVSDLFRKVNIKTSVYTPFICGGFTKLYNKDNVMKDLEDGVVVFFAGGTGHPYFTTDTCAVLRAIEIEADQILLGKSIDGIYDSDPSINPNAKRYDKISISEVIDKKLRAIDLSASIMAFENKMPFFVFSLLDGKDTIKRAVYGNINGTKVTI